MTTILSILDELASIPSSNDKLATLKKHANGELGELLQDVLRLTYDKSYNFYIKKIPEHTPSGMKDLTWGLDELSVLYTRAKTGNDGIAHLAGILSMVNDDDAEVICKIINRDVSAGFSEGTINKCWAGLIPELPMMLAQPMKDKFIAKIKYPAIAQLKADGARCIAVIDGMDVKLFSRNYKGYYGLEGLCDELATIKKGRYVVDGELVCVDKKGNVLERKVSNGVINKSSKGTISFAEAETVRFQVWDLIPFEEYFHEDDYNEPTHQRFANVVEMCKDAKRVFPIDSFVVKNLDEAREIFQRYVEKGLEGIILKNMNAPWENKRSNHSVKFKVEIDSDMIVTGMYEGQGKYVGMMGGLVCESADGKVVVNVGSGFNDADREHFWNNQSDIVGQVIEIKHNGLIKAKTKDAVYSVFLPIFKFIRDDKDPKDADTLETMNG
jgi:ATP-dependent DNA ligase